MRNSRIKQVKQLLAEIEENIPKKDFKNEHVSKSTIGWQLDHALKVVNGVCKMLEASNPKTYTSNFNLTRTVMFTFGYFPRGKGKSPKVVLPPDVITSENLLNQLAVAKTNLEKIKSLPKTSHFEHFLFGDLTKKQTVRFIEIHTKHHLKIVRDMLK